jgi:peptide/nickel transport system substrate-binding protein
MFRVNRTRRTNRLMLTMLSATVIASMLLMNAAFAQDSPSASGSAQKIVFTWADVAEPSSLNPMVGYLGVPDYTLWAISYDIPINWATKDFSPDYEHSIVTSVDASADGMTFTYHFRSGVKWSDGQPFSAEDAAWTLNYYKDNNVPNYSSDLALMDTATATDDTTMVLTSKSPTSFYSGESVFLYEYLLPEHIWGKFQDNYKGARQETGVPSVGTGPYIITKYVKNQYIQLDRNPNYWGIDNGMTPHIDQIIYRIYGNQDAEAAALQSGEVDIGTFTSANIVNTLKSRGLETRGAVIPSFGEIGINTGSAYQTDTTGGFKPHGDGHPALQDVVLRQAMRRAVDNQTLVDKVLLGYGASGVSPVQPDATTGAWEPGPDDPDLSFNLDAANQMLDDAGYTMGPDGIRIDPKSGKPLEFRFFSRSSDQNSIDIVPYVSGWMQQIGIKLDPQTLNTTKLGNVILAGDYDLFEWGWYPNPDPNYILDIFSCAQRPPDANTYRNSDMYYCNPEYDKLNDQQSSVTDVAQRIDIVHQMQSILYRDQPYIVLWNDASLEAYSSDWTGFKPQPDPNGDVLAAYGPLSFISIRPVSGTSAGGGGSSGGIPAGVWIGILAAVVVVVGGSLMLRKRREADEDEA